MADLFSVVALLSMFREALEASIISVMLQLCDRLKLGHMKKVGTVVARRCLVCTAAASGILM